MKWTIDYSGRAGKFIQKQGISDAVRSLLKDLIFRIHGKPVNLDLKKLRGQWQGYLRIRSGDIRIILKVYKKEKRIYVDKVDFRGSVYTQG
jgi:mRNA interferase RelE/StbE